MNLWFRIRRAKLLFYIRKTLCSSEEDYLAFLEKAAADYTARPLIAKDETATQDAVCDALFCKIDAHRDLGERYSFPFSAACTDQENAIAIMRHLTEHTHYCGNTKNLLPDDGAEILLHAFDLPFEKALNCRAKAIALTDVLNAYSIKALPVCATAKQGSCHFLVHIWLREENRFIVLDPSVNCFFSDKCGKALSVFELRDCIIQNKGFAVNGYTLLGRDAYKDYYQSAFLGALESLSTWKTNKRNKKELSKVCGVTFDTRIPEML